MSKINSAETLIATRDGSSTEQCILHVSPSASTPRKKIFVAHFLNHSRFQRPLCHAAPNRHLQGCCGRLIVLSRKVLDAINAILDLRPSQQSAHFAPVSPFPCGRCRASGTGISQHVSVFGGLAPPLVIPWAQLSVGFGIALGLCLLAALWPAISTGRAEPLRLLQAGRAAM